MYAILLTDENRVKECVPAYCEAYAPKEYTRVENVPDNLFENALNYKYIGGKFVFDQLPATVEPETMETPLDDVYIALAELAGMIEGLSND